MKFIKTSKIKEYLTKYSIVFGLSIISTGAYSQLDTGKYEVVIGKHFTEESYRSQQFLEMEKLWKWNSIANALIHQNPIYINYLYEDAYNSNLNSYELKNFHIVDSLLNLKDFFELRIKINDIKEDKNSLIKRLVIYGIALLNDTNSYNILKKFLNDSDDFVKLDALDLISKLYNKKIDFQVIRNIWFNGSLKKKIYAIYILKQLNSQESIELLKTISLSKNNYYSVSSLITLSQLGYISFVKPRIKQILLEAKQQEIIIGSLIAIAYFPKNDREDILNEMTLKINNKEISNLMKVLKSN